MITNSKDDIEIITVQAEIGKKKIRIINGYGPQEDDDIEKVINFWQEFEVEVIKAKDENCFVIIQMDANAKVGNSIIKDDPHTRSSNGKIMMDVVERQHLVIANSLDICKGTITRQRIFEKKTEKSVIDYIIICEELLKYLIEISIDEERIHALSRYMKKKTGNKIIMSDHNVLTSRFSITFKRKPKFIRKEFFQFKSEEGKTKFLEETSSTSKFSSCFKSKKNFGKNANLFYKTLNRTFYRCFKKVRIRSGNDRLHGENNIQLK